MTSELWIRLSDWRLALPTELAIDWGLIDPATPPEPAPVERALDILRPHLAWDHRYRETP